MQRLAGIVLVDRRGWVLLQERDGHAPVDPDLWGLVGGHVEPGEAVEVAAYRELEEETGIVLPPGGLELWREFARDEVSLAVYVAPTDLGDADIVLGEGRQIVFVDPASLAGLAFSEPARRLVTLFLGSDHYASMTS